MKHAAYCGTRNLYDDMETSAKSLIANSDVDCVWFIIEDDEFPSELPSMIRTVNVSGQEWFKPDGPNMTSNFTYMAMMRIALCHVLPDVDRVLSLDSDIVCVDDVSAVWHLPIDGCYLSASREWHRSGNGLLYCNFGVVLYNLEMLRDGKADECIDVLNRRKYRWVEQDVGNFLCQGRIHDMPSEYNSNWWTDKNAPGARIVHYAGMAQRDWHGKRDVVKYREMGWDEVMRLHDERTRSKPVLFVSEHDLDRAENLRAVWDAYDGRKMFVRGVRNITPGCSVVVCDTIPQYVAGKDFYHVNIGHGITGDKSYGMTEKRKGIDPAALAQVDYAICPSTKTVGVLAEQFGIPADKVEPLGFPRTDAYVGSRKGDGGTFMAKFGRAYLYAPTFRGPNDGDRLPDIDWYALDALLDDDEVLVVKRHYFTKKELVNGDHVHIVEIPTGDPIAPYLTDCDVLITDYSSAMFDGYLLGKPCVLTVDDMESYLKTRGMCFEYPGFYSSRWLEVEGNEERLVKMLRSAAKGGMTKVERACVEHVADMCDGHASERVCDLVRSLL